MAESNANNSLRLISYADLAQLRLQGFLGGAAELDVEESGMMVVVGLGGYERFGETFFGWRQGEPYQTAEVTLDLGRDSELPDESARQIIERLGLPVRKGATASELISTFGPPQKDKKGRPGTRLLDFVCGEGEQYLLGCVVDDHDGLVHIFFARKDYCDEDDSI
jgi:hypothetical protein